MSTAETFSPSHSETSSHESWIRAWNGSALSPLALEKNKQFFWSATGDAALPYAESRGYALALGEPLGPASAGKETLGAFVRECRAQDFLPACVPVSRAFLPIAQELDLVSFPIGDEGHLHLGSFGLQGGRYKSLRQSRSRLLRLGLTFEFWEAPLSTSQLQTLNTVSQGWLSAKRFRESRFGLGWFDRDYLEQCSVAVVRDAEQRVLAFTSCFYPASGDAVGLDLLRHLPSAPSGIMDLLVVEVALHHQERGYRMLNLGLTPLASEVTATGWAHHSLAAARRVLQALVPYSFLGLRQFKNKFRPEWQPRYMLLPRRRDLIPAALMAWSGEPRLSGLWLNP